MENRLPIDTSALSSGHAARLLAYYEAFCSDGDERHLWLAAHAAFPVVLTTDLLYKLWLNFRLDEQGKPLDIPMIAVSDLLLSTLCRPTSRHIYEMPQELRTALLLYLKNHPRFGTARIQRLAHFLRFYLRENPRQLPSRAFAKAQEFTYLAQLDPQKAAEQLLEAWNQQKDKERLRQMLAWSEQQAQLSSPGEGPAHHNPLQVAIQLVRGFQHFQEGLQDKALQELQALKGRAAKAPTDEEGAIRMDIPQAILERLPQDFLGVQEEEGEEIERTRHAKIHLFFHESLDKEKLLQQLFPEQAFPEGQALHNFQWEAPPFQPGLAYNIWAWDSSLPPELDRFVLTPGGAYYIIAPSQEDIAPLLHRIYSQVGQEKVRRLFVDQEEGGEARFTRYLEGEGEQVTVRIQLDFNDVLWGIAEKQSPESIPYVELPDKSLPTQDRDILAKANQAGLLRYHPDRLLYGPGFQSTSPAADLNRMVEIIELAKQNEGWLKGKNLETARRHPVALDLLQKMGLLFETMEEMAYLPGHMPALKQSFNDVGYTCLRHTFEFLPKDFEWRLYCRLIRVGAAFFRIKKPHIYGIPIAIQQRPLEGKRAIEVNIAHVLIEESLKGSLVFYAVLTEEISNLLSAEERELYNYDKIELLFELLQAWPEAPFYDELSAYCEDWKNVAQLLLDGKADKEEYLAACRKALKNTQELLNPLPSDQALLPPDRLAGKVADAILRIVVTEGLTSYPYKLNWESQTLLIPPHATPEMVPVEGGTFRMGDVMGDNEYDDEKPVHDVTLNSFEIGQFPVTLQEFDAFCKATGREKPDDRGWGRSNRPVINVDWYDAIEYCNWLSEIWEMEAVYTIEKDKKDPNNQNSSDKKKWLVTPNWQANGFRLPTEAEWEYAARAVLSPSGRGQGGGKVRFGNSKDIADPKEINFGASESKKKPYSLVGEYRGQTTPVDAFPPNALGLHDMSGNVHDWCWDWFGSYSSEALSNPTGPEKGSYRVLRGGSWVNGPQFVRAAYRNDDTPDFRSNVIGFRLARTL